jgi:hypothetical protein
VVTESYYKRTYQPLLGTVTWLGYEQLRWWKGKACCMYIYILSLLLSEFRCDSSFLQLYPLCTILTRRKISDRQRCIHTLVTRPLYLPSWQHLFLNCNFRKLLFIRYLDNKKKTGWGQGSACIFAFVLPNISIMGTFFAQSWIPITHFTTNGSVSMMQNGIHYHSDRQSKILPLYDLNPHMPITCYKNATNLRCKGIEWYTYISTLTI